MNISQRIQLMVELGKYLSGNDEVWQGIKDRAFHENGWFTPGYINTAVSNICDAFLTRDKLEHWVSTYEIPGTNPSYKTIGLVMAGNIPLVGFHDFLCCFITGNRVVIKTSSKDAVMIRHIVKKLADMNDSFSELASFSENLKGCDAYIATGSNNTSRYFEYYFAKYPHIIRKNRTSVAVLDGSERAEELSALADDVMLYFGLGCRNVTQVYVPANYDFVPLLDAMRKYGWVGDHHKYRNNYDYNLAIHMLNSDYYMTNDSTMVVENASPFSPISQLNYQFYDQPEPVLEKLQHSDEIQAIIGHYGIPFGKVQRPSLMEYADGTDTVAWLKSLS